MSQHAWFLENIASYVADGLETDERERFEQHLAACPACAQMLDEIRALDQRMEHLFADVRPKAELEDRMIRALRAAPNRQNLQIPFFVRVAMGLAAVLVLGILGAGVMER